MPLLRLDLKQGQTVAGRQVCGVLGLLSSMYAQRPGTRTLVRSFVRIESFTNTNTPAGRLSTLAFKSGPRVRSTRIGTRYASVLSFPFSECRVPRFPLRFPFLPWGSATARERQLRSVTLRARTGARHCLSHSRKRSPPHPQGTRCPGPNASSSATTSPKVAVVAS